MRRDGGNEVTLYPLFHPAAALYTPSMQTVLEQDFARIPKLLGSERRSSAPQGSPAPGPVAEPVGPAVQLGLF